MRNEIAYWSDYFTKAPMTPREVTLRFSNILLFVEVFKKGYKNKGMCAFRNSCLVEGCNARHWSRPTTKQMRLELASLRLGGGDNSV